MRNELEEAQKRDILAQAQLLDIQRQYCTFFFTSLTLVVDNEMRAKQLELDMAVNELDKINQEYSLLRVRALRGHADAKGKVERGVTIKRRHR
jgi:hypothetical protein